MRGWAYVGGGDALVIIKEPQKIVLKVFTFSKIFKTQLWLFTSCVFLTRKCRTKLVLFQNLEKNRNIKNRLERLLSDKRWVFSANISSAARLAAVTRTVLCSFHPNIGKSTNLWILSETNWDPRKAGADTGVTVKAHTHSVEWMTINAKGIVIC